MTTTTQISGLNQELLNYAERLGICPVYPSYEVTKTAIHPFFPKLVSQSSSVQELLESVGLVVIHDSSPNYKPKRISWSIATTQDEANKQLETYDISSFRAIRKALGINYHWIFLVPSKTLSNFSLEELTEGHVDFKCDEMPECWILDRFR